MVLLNDDLPKPGPRQTVKKTRKKKSAGTGESSPPGLRRWWLLILAFLLQVSASHSAALRIPASFAPGLVWTSYTVLVVGAISNRHLWGFRFFLLGLALNITVMALNGWRMPITPHALMQAGFPLEASQESGSHLSSIKSILLLREQTRAWFLSDIIVISQIRRVFSIGDLVIICSAGFVLLEILMARRRTPIKDRILSPEEIVIG